MRPNPKSDLVLFRFYEFIRSTSIRSHHFAMTGLGALVHVSCHGLLSIHVALVGGGDVEAVDDVGQENGEAVEVVEVAVDAEGLAIALLLELAHVLTRCEPNDDVRWAIQNANFV